MKNNKFLPLGTVVLLKGGTHRVMIVGYCTVDPKISETKMFDYISCFYPEGIFSLDKIIAFNHDDINSIYHIGYSDEEQATFINKLIEINKNYVDDNNNLKVSPDELLLQEVKGGN